MSYIKLNNNLKTYSNYLIYLKSQIQSNFVKYFHIYIKSIFLVSIPAKLKIIWNLDLHISNQSTFKINAD
jgi:hypothetical protein